MRLVSQRAKLISLPEIASERPSAISQIRPQWDMRTVLSSDASALGSFW